MWRVDAGGSADWRDGDHVWTLQIAGGPIGIRLVKADRVASRSSGGSQAGGDGVPLFSIGPAGFSTGLAGSDRFPDLGEVFVRGDELHLDYPQIDGAEGDGAYSVEVVCRVVESEVFANRGGRLVTEWTIAIQTSRLESHPMLDLWARGKRIRRLTPADHPSNSDQGPRTAETASLSTEFCEEVEGSGDEPLGVRHAAPITAVSGGEASVAVLLDPRDYPWTLDLSDDHGLCQRLFGDFLEKGVIRKARPWVVVDDRGEAVEQTEDVSAVDGESNAGSALVRRWHELCRTPLPLTA